MIYDRMIEWESGRVFRLAKNVRQYREWAADKKTSYRTRLMYDKWAAQYEAWIMDAARRVEAWLLLTIDD